MILNAKTSTFNMLRYMLTPKHMKTITGKDRVVYRISNNFNKSKENKRKEN